MPPPLFEMDIFVNGRTLPKYRSQDIVQDQDVEFVTGEVGSEYLVEVRQGPGHRSPVTLEMLIDGRQVFNQPAYKVLKGKRRFTGFELSTLRENLPTGGCRRQTNSARFRFKEPEETMSADRQQFGKIEVQLYLGVQKRRDAREGVTRTRNILPLEPTRRKKDGDNCLITEDGMRFRTVDTLGANDNIIVQGEFLTSITLYYRKPEILELLNIDPIRVPASSSASHGESPNEEASRLGQTHINGEQSFEVSVAQALHASLQEVEDTEAESLQRALEQSLQQSVDAREEDSVTQAITASLQGVAETEAESVHRALEQSLLTVRQSHHEGFNEVHAGQDAREAGSSNDGPSERTRIVSDGLQVQDGARHISIEFPQEEALSMNYYSLANGVYVCIEWKPDRSGASPKPYEYEFIYCRQAGGYFELREDEVSNANGMIEFVLRRTEPRGGRMIFDQALAPVAPEARLPEVTSRSPETFIIHSEPSLRTTSSASGSSNTPEVVMNVSAELVSNHGPLIETFFRVSVYTVVRTISNCMIELFLRWTGPSGNLVGLDQFLANAAPAVCLPDDGSRSPRNLVVNTASTAHALGHGGASSSNHFAPARVLVYRAPASASSASSDIPLTMVSAPPELSSNHCLMMDAKVRTSAGIEYACDLQPGAELHSLRPLDGELVLTKAVLRRVQRLPARNRDVITSDFSIQGSAMWLSVTSLHYLLIRDDESQLRAVVATELVPGAQHLVTVLIDDSARFIKQVPARIDCTSRETRSCEVISLELEGDAAAVMLGMDGRLVVVFSNQPQPESKIVVNPRSGFLDVVDPSDIKVVHPSSDPTDRRAQSSHTYRTIRQPHDSECRSGCRFYFMGRCRNGASCTGCHNEEHRHEKNPRRRARHNRSS